MQLLADTMEVAAIIKRDVPDLLNIQCVCHKLALACADACRDLSYIIQES